MANLTDLRLAVRRLTRSPGFTAAAVLTLGLGLGGALTVYAWIQSLVLRPFPGVADGRSLKQVWSETLQGDAVSFSVPEARELAAALAPAVQLAAHHIEAMNLTDERDPERVWGGIVTGNYFSVLGVEPALGRFFLPDEDAAPMAKPAVVLAHAFWRRRFAADPAIVGRSISLNNQSFTVVGIGPERFGGAVNGLMMDLFVPLANQPAVVPGGNRLDDHSSHWLETLARLGPGVSLSQARALLDAPHASLRERFPEAYRNRSYRVAEQWNGPWGATQYMASTMMVLAAMVLLVLVVACANVGALLLVRELGRRREAAVRLALGAGRGQLLRSNLAESVLLAGSAVGLGLLLSLWARGLLMSLMPPLPLPVAPQLELGASGLLVAMGLGALVAALCALAPLLQVRAFAVADALRGAAAIGGERDRQRLRAALVVVQIGLSTILLVASALFLRALDAGVRADPGFRTRGVLLAAVNLFPNGYDEESGPRLQQRLLERLRSLPGVEAAALGRQLPLDLGGSSSREITVEGFETAADQSPRVRFNTVSDGYFQVFEIPLVAGRDFDASLDRPDTALKVVINETMARRFWPAGNALGGRVAWGGAQATVIGIARDIKTHELGEPAAPFLWLPYAQAYRGDAVLHVQAGPGLNSLALLPAVRGAVAELDPGLPLFAVKSIEEHLRIAVLKQSLAARMLGALGVLALVLAGVGLYGLVSYAVAQRTRDLGLRLALGARPRALMRQVLGHGLRLAVAGIAVGMTLAVLVGGALSGLLLGVPPRDPLALGAVAATLLGVALLATWLPTRRITRIDPMIALRHE